MSTHKNSKKEISLLKQAEKVSPGIIERIKKANDQNKKDHVKLVQERNQGERHGHYYLDLEKSFENILPNCLNEDGEMDEMKLAHYESALLSAPTKYDR